MRLLLILGSMMLASCSDTPSCSDAYTKFYAAGCTLHDANGSAISVDTEISECQSTLDQVKDNSSCEDAYDAYLGCLDGVEASSGTTSSATCNSCYMEQAAVASCQSGSSS